MCCSRYTQASADIAYETKKILAAIGRNREAAQGSSGWSREGTPECGEARILQQSKPEISALAEERNGFAHNEPLGVYLGKDEQVGNELCLASGGNIALVEVRGEVLRTAEAHFSIKANELGLMCQKIR